MLTTREQVCETRRKHIKMTRSRSKRFYRKVFCTLKNHDPTFEKEIRLFKTFLVIDLLRKNNFSAKIEVSG